MTNANEHLEKIPFRDQMIPRGDERITPYLSDTLMRGDPDLVCRATAGRATACRARDLKDLKQIIVYCNTHRIPVTFCGSQTSLTGASVALEGLLVSVKSWDRILDISVDSKTGVSRATAQPGILLGDFQRLVAAEGFFYPPDPTSRNEAQLGGTVGTNATGEDSLLYGPTRRYVRRLKLLFADGGEHEVVRETPYVGPTKNRAGYLLEGDLIERFTGSEGTLALITEVTVDLLPEPPDHFVGWAFFPDLPSALEFVVRAESRSDIRPRALELIDRRALEIVACQERSPGIPDGAGSLIVFKQEYRDAAEREVMLGRWFSLIGEVLEKAGGTALLDGTVIADDPATRERFRLLRHAVPSTINEEAASYAAAGGGKVSTDWWVPVERLREMMELAASESDRLGVPYLVFGHIGDGHPHINYLARDAGEMNQAQRLLVSQCRRAVTFGGGVAGEHGLGKLYRHLLPIQCSSSLIRRMREVKGQYDPHGIFGRGNIFAV